MSSLKKDVANPPVKAPNPPLCILGLVLFLGFAFCRHQALAQTGDTVSAWMREARSELQLRGNHAAQLSNDLLQKLEDTLTLPTRTGEATRNGDPDDNS